MSEEIKIDKKIYTTVNIAAVSIKHYNLCLKKDEKIPSEQLQEFTYDRLERDEQEFLFGVMAEGHITGKKTSDGISLKAEVDMLDLINFLGLTPGGNRYKKLKEILERLKTREVTKIVSKKVDDKKILHNLVKGAAIISDFDFEKKDDNKLYKLTEFEQFRRITIKMYFSKTFSDILMHDNRIAFYQRNKDIIRKIQKQPTYARDIINYMIPIMGDVELNLYEVLEDIHNNAETARKAKQKLLKDYQENEEVRSLFLSCGLKIVKSQEIMKSVKGFLQVDPVFFMDGRKA